MQYSIPAFVAPTTIPLNAPATSALFNNQVQSTNGINASLTLVTNNQAVQSGNSNVTVVLNQTVLVEANNTSSNIAVNLPLGTQTKYVTIIKTTNSTNLVNITPGAGDTIEDPWLQSYSASVLTLRYIQESVILEKTGTVWRVVTLRQQMPASRAYKDNAQTITTTPTNVSFNIDTGFPAANAYDDFAIHNSGTGVVTVPRAGRYLVSGAVAIDTGGTPAFAALGINKNASPIYLRNFPDNAATSTAVTTTGISDIVRCAAGDTLSIQASVSAGTRALFNTGATRSLYTFFEVSYLGI